MKFIDRATRAFDWVDVLIVNAAAGAAILLGYSYGVAVGVGLGAVAFGAAVEVIVQRLRRKQ